MPARARTSSRPTCVSMLCCMQLVDVCSCCAAQLVDELIIRVRACGRDYAIPKISQKQLERAAREEAKQVLLGVGAVLHGGGGPRGGIPGECPAGLGPSWPLMVAWPVK